MPVSISIRRLWLRRLSAALGALGILGASLSGCGGGGAVASGGGSPSGGGTAGTPSPTPGSYVGRSACSANTHQSGRARWTILVYMQAANNLQPDSLQNVAQMASVGSNSDVNIVLQWKQIPASLTQSCSGCNPAFYGVRRYLISPHSTADVTAIGGGNTNSLQADRLADPPNNTPVSYTSAPQPTDTNRDPNGRVNGTEDMGSYKALQDFVQWGTKSYPADNMALLIWDHGTGWRNVYRSVRTGASGRALASGVSSRAVAQDDETQNEIETWELPNALAGVAQPLDMIIFDCSLQQMVEVAYQVRQSARIMVASEESPPSPGYPYDKWLAALKTTASTASICDLGHTIIQDFVTDPTYVSNTNGYANQLTQSTIDLSRMDAVATTLNAFGVALNSHVQDQATILFAARQNAQHYTSSYSDNKDLYDYADRVRTTTAATDLQQAALNMENALTGTNGAVLDAAHGPYNQSGSHGLAVYIPAASSFLPAYSNLALALSAPNWPTFLKDQIQ